MKNLILIILVIALITNNLISQNIDTKNSFQFSCGKSKYIQNMNSNSPYTYTVEYYRNIKQLFETGISINNINYYINRDLLIIENNIGINFNFYIVNNKKIFWNIGTGGIYFKTKSNTIHFYPSDIATSIYDRNYGYQINSIIGFNINKNLSFFAGYKFIDKLSSKIKYINFSEYPNYFIPDANRQQLELGLKVRF
jgi:hypothetical protein